MLFAAKLLIAFEVWVGQYFNPFHIFPKVHDAFGKGPSVPIRMNEHWTDWLHSVLNKRYHGHWCRFEATGDLISCFNAERIFTPDGLGGTVHRNVFHHENQTETDCSSCGPWTLTEEKCSLPDGVAHPAKYEVMRTLVVPDGSGAWLTPVNHKHEPMGAEMFLHHGLYLRMSIVARHESNGDLGTIAFIREDTRFHSSYSPSPDWTNCVDCSIWTPFELFQVLAGTIEIGVGNGHAIYHDLKLKGIYDAHFSILMTEFANTDSMAMMFDDNAVALLLPKTRRETCIYGIVWKIENMIRTLKITWENGKIDNVEVLQFHTVHFSTEVSR